MPDELNVHRVLGDQPFAEIGRPVWAVTDSPHRCVVVAGDLGHVMWRGTGQWFGHRIGVYEAGTLRPRHVVASRHPVCAVEPHPELPLVAVGTGRYDGSWDFEGELLLLHLETGRVTNLLSKSRQVRHLRWLEDGRLAMLLSPEDKDGGFRKGFELAVAADDWLSAPSGLIDPDRARHPMVESGLLHDPRVEDTLARLTQGRWRRRAEVRDLAVLADGRVLATGRHTDLECWDPSGGLTWALPAAGEGSVRVEAAPDGGSAWVTYRGYQRDEVTGRQADRGTTVRRIATADGRVVDLVDMPSAPAPSATREGWLALCPRGRTAHAARLLAPAHQEVARLALAPNHSNSPALRVRHSTRLLYVDGPGPDGDAPWINVIEPPGEQGQAVLRALFPLHWDPASTLQPWCGPAVELTDALVHAGRSYRRGATYAEAREGTYVVSRGLPDGAARWVYETDKPLADLDGDEQRVYVAFLTGEVEILDSATGEVRARHTLSVHGHPVTPMSVAYRSDQRRLVVGTVDGRILDCSVPE
ncbi:MULTISPECIES: hypothetical protein [unclassified Streptomyces]|uniref:hypothetical protein n=1 Tax=unclassified Streptomyces TaxID=2593676 RepID=UPI0007480396|nr:MULTISPECIES: hypothetical protein [unclassified Streptomyces]KUL70654.1 hypothetical protein ADL33_27765 [Streptomyces sp. NRRL WC-3604]KUL77284.1 hypothetical protein ADL34_10075 [Streptomyces sp. NRRL WC-3605]